MQDLPEGSPEPGRDAARAELPRVLLVDDEPQNLALYRRVLRPLCETLTAANGSEALAIARQQALTAVVTDQRMPEMTGIELVQHLQGVDSSLPVIVATAYTDLRPVLDAINTCWLYGYLIKPVQPEQLRAVVGRAIKERSLAVRLEDEFSRLARENDELRGGNARLRETSEHITKSNEELLKTCQALEEAYQRMTELAHRDELTQLLNRRSFITNLQAEFGRCRRYRRQASLLILDVDDFKRINDTYGHPVGDRALVLTARLLQRNIRAQDRGFRLGGDEFAVILPETREEDALAVAHKLVETVLRESPAELPAALHISVGHKGLSDDVQSADEWYGLADARLYDTKKEKGSP